METRDMHGHSDCASCMMHGRGHWGHIMIKVLVALFIFWCGVQFGELKSVLHGGYGYGMMGSYNATYGVPRMMGGWVAQ